MGEGEDGEPAITGSADRRPALGHRGEADVVEPGALRQSRRPARPHDRQWIRGVERRAPGERIAVDAGRVEWRVDRDHRLRPLDDVVALVRAEARVDPGGDRAGADDGLVGDGVVDAAGQRDRDHVALADATRLQPLRAGIARGGPPAERDPACRSVVDRLHEGVDLGRVVEHCVEQVEQRGNH